MNVSPKACFVSYRRIASINVHHNFVEFVSLATQPQKGSCHGHWYISSWCKQLSKNPRSRFAKKLRKDWTAEMFGTKGTVRVPRTLTIHLLSVSCSSNSSSPGIRLHIPLVSKIQAQLLHFPHLVLFALKRGQPPLVKNSPCARANSSAIILQRKQNTNQTTNTVKDAT